MLCCWLLNSCLQHVKHHQILIPSDLSSLSAVALLFTNFKDVSLSKTNYQYRICHSHSVSLSVSVTQSLGIGTGNANGTATVTVAVPVALAVAVALKAVRRCRPQSMSAACQLRSPVAVGPPPNAVWLLLSSAPFPSAAHP